MSDYRITFPEVAMYTVQAYLSQLYRDTRANPQEMHIAETNYDTLARSLVPDFVPDAFHYDLMGKAWVDEQVAWVQDRRNRLDGIINFTTGQVIKLIREAEQEPGTVIFREEERDLSKDEDIQQRLMLNTFLNPPQADMSAFLAQLANDTLRTEVEEPGSLGIVTIKRHEITP